MAKTKKERAKEDYLRHKEVYIARTRKRYLEKKEEILAQKKIAYQAFKLTPEYKEYRKRNRAKRRSTPKGKLHDNFSCLIRNSINNKGGRSWESLVSYTCEELKFHLESQFQEGMTWENYGTWHVDHIKPVCSFRFDKAEDQGFQECWKLENLRPLWKADNLRKSFEDKKLSVLR